MLRMGAEEAGERKEGPADPGWDVAALRPEAQECHVGELYKEALIQSRKEGPPFYIYIYDSTQDTRHKYLASPLEIVKSLITEWQETQREKLFRQKFACFKV